jgi:hypothetical protein
MVHCRGCGKEILESSPTCSSCGAAQSVGEGGSTNTIITSYEQVPWFRKSWFIVVGFLIFAPVTLYSLFSGDIYYQKNGQLVIYSKTVKIVTMVLCLMQSIWVIGKILGLK